MLKYYIKKAEAGDVIEGAKQTQQANLTSPSGLATGVADSVIDASTDVENKLLGGWEKDSVDDVANAAAKVATKFGPWGYLAAGVIKTVNFASKAFGERIEGFDGGTGSSGFRDFTVESKQFRGFNPFGASKASQAHQKNVQDQKTKFAAAKSVVNSQKQQNDARRQALENQNMTTEQQLSGGLDYGAVLARQGTKLERVEDDLNEIDIITLFNQFNVNKQVEILKSGGSVIPSGALHKNRHNMDVPELEGQITNKGIPVISVEEGGEITQHAEIEKDEVIIDLELSKKLEKLMKDGSEAAAIEAGRSLSNELMENTTDNTGLIQKIIGDENKD